ncbi:MAG: hypothetical protein ACRDP6_24855 [Actinoallomurus sp.]
MTAPRHRIASRRRTELTDEARSALRQLLDRIEWKAAKQSNGNDRPVVVNPGSGPRTPGGCHVRRA